MGSFVHLKRILTVVASNVCQLVSNIKEISFCDLIYISINSFLHPFKKHVVDNLPIGTLPNKNVNQINEYIHKDLKDRPYFLIILKIIKQEY